MDFCIKISTRKESSFSYVSGILTRRYTEIKKSKRRHLPWSSSNKDPKHNWNGKKSRCWYNFWWIGDNDSQSSGQIKKIFKDLTKNYSFQSCLAHHVFRVSNHGIDIGKKVCDFDLRYQKHFRAAQQSRVELNIPEGLVIMQQF